MTYEKITTDIEFLCRNIWKVMARKNQVVDLETLKEKKKSKSTLSSYFGRGSPSAKSKVEKEKVQAKRCTVYPKAAKRFIPCVILVHFAFILRSIAVQLLPQQQNFLL